MKCAFFNSKKGSVLLLAVSVMAVLSLMALTAYEVTGNIGRSTRRMALRQQALSVADSSLEMLYTQFMQMVTGYTTSLGDLAPNAKYCSDYLNFQKNTSKAPTGAAFPELSAYYPSVPNFSSTRLDDTSVGVITNYSIAPLDKFGRVSSSVGMVQTVNPIGSFEGRAFRYLATVDVALPTVDGQTVNAHVSRVFEYQSKSFLNYAIFSNVIMELNPGAAMVVTGPVHSNAEMHVGYGGGKLTFTDTVTCSGTISTKPVSGDPAHSSSSDGSSNVTGLGWTNRSQNVGQITPLGVTSASFSGSDSNPNNDNYHGVVELSSSTNIYPDPFSPYDARSDTKTQAFDAQDLQTVRFANIADFVITITNSGSGNVTSKGDSVDISYVNPSDTTSMTTRNSKSDPDDPIVKAFMSALTVDASFIGDYREGTGSSMAAVNLTTLNVAALKAALDAGKITPSAGSKTGLGIYIVDKRARVTGTTVTNPTMSSGKIFPALTGTMWWQNGGLTTGTINGVTTTGTALTGTSVINGTFTGVEPGIRIVGGSALPEGGLTIVTPNPVYIQGDYNTGSPISNGTAAIQPKAASTSSTWGATHDSTTVTLAQANNNQTYTYNQGVPYTNVDGSSDTYYWQPSAIVADAINVLSNNWSDARSTSAIGSRVASAATTINAAFISGNVDTTSSSYSGGIENYPRLHENWSNKYLNYVGSLILMYNSTQATGLWGNASYSAATRRWAYDKNFMTFGVPLLSGGGSATGGAAGGGSRKIVAAGGGQCFQRKQYVARSVQ